MHSLMLFEVSFPIRSVAADVAGVYGALAHPRHFGGAHGTVDGSREALEINNNNNNKIMQCKEKVGKKQNKTKQNKKKKK